MATRLRNCVECPKCQTRYLAGFSPYSNGSYLKPFVARFQKEWTLSCACGAASRWSWDELRLYLISTEAYVRGYGSPEEVLPAGERMQLWR